MSESELSKDYWKILFARKKILIHDEDKVLKVHSMECRIEKFLRMISFTV